MRYAFTMIELVFVILIIGILAAIAIPKLLVTRDDATTVTIATQAKEGMKELISYYTSQGKEINFSKIAKNKSSQIVLNELITRGWVQVKDDNHSVLYSDRKNKVVCINYYTNGFQIKVETNSSNNTPLCEDIKRFIKDRNYSILNSTVNF